MSFDRNRLTSECKQSSHRAGRAAARRSIVHTSPVGVGWIRRLPPECLIRSYVYTHYKVGGLAPGSLCGAPPQLSRCRKCDNWDYLSAKSPHRSIWAVFRPPTARGRARTASLGQVRASELRRQKAATERTAEIRHGHRVACSVPQHSSGGQDVKLSCERS